MIKSCNEWEKMCESLDFSHRRKIHYNSIYNFLYHYKDLTNTRKDSVSLLIEQYIDFVTEKGLQLSKKESRSLFYSHIMKIGQYFRDELGFKSRLSIDGALLGGGTIDLLLYILGLLKYTFNLPVFTLILLVNTVLIRVTYGTKRKLYGPDY
ncbi:MAG TPA: hypothetical protein DHV26_13930 [Cytophagales bacterium]|nr:hypothetical protein [Cytophagales bacterium]